MNKFLIFFIVVNIIYSCSPINKQHGYLLDDVLVSSDKISKFEVNITSNTEIYEAMGSPSIEIIDVNNVWIYLISLKEKNIFEDDVITFQSIFRFEFSKDGILLNKSVITQDEFQVIAFSTEKTKVRRDAYGITDQLYQAFTRGE